MSADPKPLVIEYTNYRGETSVRRIMPGRVFWGSNKWHPEPQWLLDANDLDKGETRIFAMKDMRPVKFSGISDPPACSHCEGTGQAEPHGLLSARCPVCDGSCVEDDK